MMIGWQKFLGVIGIFGLVGLFSTCNTSLTDKKDATDQATTTADDDDIADEPIDRPGSIAGINLLDCQAFEPVTASGADVEIGCGYYPEAGQKSGELSNLKVHIIDKNGQAKAISTVANSDPESDWHFIFSVDKDSVDTIDVVNAAFQADGKDVLVEGQVKLAIKAAIIQFNTQDSLDFGTGPLRRDTAKALGITVTTGSGIATPRMRKQPELSGAFRYAPMSPNRKASRNNFQDLTPHVLPGRQLMSPVTVFWNWFFGPQRLTSTATYLCLSTLMA